jgi:hypothetical protein
MALDTAPFERIGIHVSSLELERQFVSALSDVLPDRVSSRPSQDLSAAEVKTLTRGGLDLSPQGAHSADGGAGNPLLRGAMGYAAVVTASYTVADAAHRLGVDGSRIRQRLAARTLYGVKHEGNWRIPAFQFQDGVAGSLIPYLDQVVPFLDPDLSPVTVARWFRLPNPDFTGVSGGTADDEPVSPLEWLASGGRPEPVAVLARSVGAGL